MTRPQPVPGRSYRVRVYGRLRLAPLAIGMALLLAATVLASGQGTLAPAVAAPAPRPGSAKGEPSRPTPLVAPGSNLVIDDYFVHVPPVITGRLEVLVALHGMGGAGPAFGETILGRADRERWVVVAPHFAYGDWRDPGQVAREESARFIPRLHELLAQLPARTGLDLDPRTAIYGHSRGAQLAQRFAMVYPEQTQAVAALSAGTYTLPMREAPAGGDRVALPYPFGTGDLRERFGRDLDLAALQRIPFWIGVGGDDRNPADLPRQWDPYLGETRVARAETFVQRLAEAGIPVQLAVFPGAGHSLTDEMRSAAMDFIAALP